LSKRLEKGLLDARTQTPLSKVAGLHTLLSGLIDQCIDLRVKLLRLVVEARDLLVHRHAVVPFID
jgi:hypothetical protein